jgi:hypothetical protein
LIDSRSWPASLFEMLVRCKTSIGHHYCGHVRPETALENGPITRMSLHDVLAVIGSRACLPRGRSSVE